MKKLLLLSIAIYCFSLVSVGAETVLFSGDKTTSLFSRMDIISWAMGETKDDARYVNFGTDAEPAFSEIADNPVKTGLNTSEKALHMSALKGNSWWPNFLIMNLTEGITITEENRYLHVYHYRENLNKGFSLYVTDGTLPEDVDKGTKRWDMDLKAAATWEDLVVDLKWFIDNQQPLTAVSFLVDRNWGGEAEPATNYYWDEIVLNNSNLPRGIKLYTEKEIAIDLGNATSESKYVGTLDLQNTENTSEIVANPFTDQSTKAPLDNIMKFSKSANASWWQGGPRFVLNGTLPVGTDGTSAYLHAFVNIPEVEDGKDYYVVQLNAKDFAGNQIDSGDALKYWSDDKGNWVDLVFDVTSLGYVSEFQLRFDVRRDDTDNYINSPAGVFYLDGLEINGSEEQRDASSTEAVYNHNTSNIKVFSSNQNIIVEGTDVASIEVYSILGNKISKTVAGNYKTEIPVNQNGVFFVKTISKDKVISSSKVLVR
jgi:hypothetical protein